ncbi:DUF1289 domain-containing protein [Duganella qianjiadongensis]|uniref:DUF1289 domain-containing protein n=1 Tax=Duganella qianjiadongensis TaxID=2692176 RepID=A0ABW9VQS3_9BURK|nr:DUF1289 domain-containing protein [Duganella qianjiadongensis]MYM40764.1 DUF1289 domain-containing protein [Duganella qianjiadongensis]
MTEFANIPPANSAPGTSLAAPVPSPCVSLCKMDQDRQYCMGCMRTIEEIIAWSKADDDYKRAVWAKLPERRASQPQDAA